MLTLPAPSVPKIAELGPSALLNHAVSDVLFVQFSSAFIVPEMRAMTPSDALFVPIVIIVIAYGIWQFSRLAGRRGWLR